MRRKLSIAGVFLVAASFLLNACGLSGSDTEQGVENRQGSVAQRQTNFARAVAKYQQPTQENFPMREALVKYTQRQDLLNHPWYIYVANDCYSCPNGVAYQYYIGQTYPQSTCNFLGSTEEVQRVDHDNDGVPGTYMKFQAPSLDGIYYGSGATTGGCDYFFFDVATDGLQVVHHDWKWFVSDRPLLLDAKLIQSK